MRRSFFIGFNRSGWSFSVLLLTQACAAVIAILAIFWPAVEPPIAIASEPGSAQQLSSGLQFVPADSALFIYGNLSKIWHHPTLVNVRKSDQKLFDDLAAQAKLLFGASADDVKSVVAWLPQLKGPGDERRFGIAVTFHKPYDKDKIQKGADTLLSPELKVKVVAVDERLVLVLVGMGDEQAKPRPAGEEGPLTAALRDAATGTHVAVAGATLENLPDEIRRDDLPAEVRPYQPLLKAVSIRAAVDVGKTIDLDVRVKASSAAEAINCEKSLGALSTLIQEQLDKGTKELDKEAAKVPGLKDLVAIVKAGAAAAKSAKYSTIGAETRVTVSLSTELPFGPAFAATRKYASGGGSAAGTAQASNNLKQIALAMHNYHDTYGAFPPAAVCDKKGNPQLSWRVLILPFIGQQNLYQQFKLDEPWDSPNNKKLLAKMPKTYSIPDLTKEGGTDTYFRVFVGKGAGFDYLVGTKITQITDGTSNTIMCVTGAEAVPWTKPDELEFDPEKDMTKKLGTLPDGTVLAAMFDGSVRRFGKKPSQKALNALITVNGGEVIGPDDLP